MGENVGYSRPIDHLIKGALVMKSGPNLFIKTACNSLWMFFATLHETIMKHSAKPEIHNKKKGKKSN